MYSQHDNRVERMFCKHRLLQSTVKVAPVPHLVVGDRGARRHEFPELLQGRSYSVTLSACEGFSVLVAVLGASISQGIIDNQSGWIGPVQSIERLR